MTLGEKLKEARKEAGLSQEQLAEKLSVSRSAVAKWETDKGLPDVNNLKGIAQLLNVSVDFLLDEEEKLNFQETKEAINLDDYTVTGKCRGKKDAACYEKYKTADAIYSLVRTKKMSKMEWWFDFIVQPGVVQMADYLNDMSSFYLVETGNKQILVKVSSDFIVSMELTKKVRPEKFVIGKYQYKKMINLLL